MRENEAKQFDLRSYSRALWRRKWLLIVPVIVAGITGYLISVSLSPIYESKSTVTVRMQERLSEPLAKLVGRSPVEEQLSRLQEKVRSRTFLVELVRALNMTDDESVRRWAERMHERDPSVSVDDFAESRVVGFLRDRISIVRSAANVFRVVVRDHDPERATLLAQHITNAFVSASNREQLEEIRSVHDFSVEQLVIYKQKLDEAERRMQEFQEGRITSAPIENPVTPQNVGRVDMLLSQVSVENDRAQERLTDRREILRGIAGAEYTLLGRLESQTLIALTAQLVSLEREVAPVMIRSSSDGPEIASLYVNIADKKAELRSEAKAFLLSSLSDASPQFLDAYAELKVAEAEVAMLDERRMTLTRLLWSYTQGRASEPQEQMEFTRLRQEVESNRALYEAFLEQSAAGQITEALEAARAGGRFEIIEPPTRPVSPVAPNVLMIVVLSVFGGLVVGLGAVLASEQSDTSFKTVSEIKEATGLPVLATLPSAEIFRAIGRREKGLRKNGMTLSGGRSALIRHMLRETPVSFEFRRMARKLPAGGKRMPRSLVVTSSYRGEGKTTVAACLAISLAKHHQGKTVLVDCDLRKPRTHRLMEVSSRPGLSDAVKRGRLDDGDLKATALSNLFVLPCGAQRKDVSQIIDAFPDSCVLSELTARFDHVIIDTAPNVAVPDALLVGGVVDAVVIVVKAGQTPREVVERGVTLQSEERDNIAGIVINNIEHVLPYYYDYKYYGYGPTGSSEEGDS